MKIVTYITAIILMLFGLSFALLNATPVPLNYYVGVSHISLSLLLVLTVGLGILIGFIVSLWRILKLKRKNHQFKNRIKQLEQEIVAIRVPENKGLE